MSCELVCVWLCSRHWLESAIVACKRLDQQKPASSCSVPIWFAFLAFPCLWRECLEWPMSITGFLFAVIWIDGCLCEIWWDAFADVEEPLATFKQIMSVLCFCEVSIWMRAFAIISFVQTNIMWLASANNVDRDNLLTTQRPMVAFDFIMHHRNRPHDHVSIPHKHTHVCHGMVDLKELPPSHVFYLFNILNSNKKKKKFWMWMWKKNKWFHIVLWHRTITSSNGIKWCMWNDISSAIMLFGSIKSCRYDTCRSFAYELKFLFSYMFETMRKWWNESKQIKADTADE